MPHKNGKFIDSESTVNHKRLIAQKCERMSYRNDIVCIMHKKLRMSGMPQTFFSNSEQGS